jgi:outer membrane protein assembly factor BamB
MHSLHALRKLPIPALACLIGLLHPALNAQTEGTSQWSFLTSGPVSGSPAVASDGTIYVGNEASIASQSRLYAIRADGSLRWQFTGASDWFTGTPAVGPDGTIYIGSWDGRLYAINPATGTARWSYTTLGFIASSPAVAADGTIYVGSADRSLHAINPDGSAKWTYLVSDWVDSSPAIAGDGTIYFGSYDNYLYALNPNGTLRWRFNAGDDVTSSPAIGADGTIYIGSANGRLYALDGANGAKRWEYATGAGIAASPIVGASGTVYVGSIDGFFYAINGSSGALVWRANLGAEIFSTATIRADGTLIVGAGVSVCAINSDGSIRWRLATGDFVDSSPLVTSDGTIYVGSSDRRLYSVRGNGQGLDSSAPWPTFHKDSPRLGRSSAIAAGGSGTVPTITAILDSQVSTAGNTVSMNVTAEGSGQLSYQWRKNGIAIAGATSSSLTLPSVSTSDAGSYTVAVSNAAGSTTSAALVLTVNAVIIPQPAGIGVDGSGNLYVTDPSTNVLHRVTAAGVVSTLAGASGSAGSTDGTGSAARFNQPRSLSTNSDGTSHIADTGNATIRTATAAGVVTTLAGSAGSRGNTDGTGSSATFNGPQAIARDTSGNLYVADTLNHTVRRVTPAGAVTTIAGSAGQSGSTDGSGTAARFNSPSGIAVDSSANVFIADTTNNTIRRIAANSTTVTTLAGLSGVTGSSDGEGSGALFNRPTGLAIDSAGNVYVADTGNSAIRRVTPAGSVSTFAGLPSIAGMQDGTAFGAYFNQPQAIAFDSAGNLWVADTGNSALRRISTSGRVTTLSLTTGSGGGSTGGTGGTTPTTPTTPTGSGGGGGGGAPTPLAAVVIAALLFARGTLRRASVN